jgi:TRAP-type C4-dicarboxylate transport system permease small subunit
VARVGKNGKRKSKGRGAPQPKAQANGAAHGVDDDALDAEDAAPAEPEPKSAEGEAVEPLGAIAANEPLAEAPETSQLEAAHGAAWGEPLYRFDQAWTRFEQRLIVFVLLAELASLCAWVLLNDLTETTTKATTAHGGGGGSSDGTIFRGILGAVAIGCAAWFATKKQPLKIRRGAAIGGALLGAVIAPAWAGLGTDYLENVKGWLQEGSTLTLMGGLRGVATRLTLWLALLGGSLATGSGRHIHIDLVYRLLPKQLRLPASLLGMLAAALVCFAGVWGFVDHIAINSFGSRAEDPAAQKIEKVAHGVGDNLFLLRKQIGLDLRTLPRVIGGAKYDSWMSGKQWNDWVDDGGFGDRWPGDQVQSIKVPDDTTSHSPLVLSPDGTNTRGVLVQALGLVFPFGLLAIALRFVLRAILTASGHYSTDPDHAAKEELAALTRKG